MNKQRYMLDTNSVSYLLKGHPILTQRVVATPMASLCISIITKGELLFGLAKRPDAKRLHLAVREFLRRVDALPWEDGAAEYYAEIRVKVGAQAKTFAPLDLLIAAHALSQKFILITNDSAFKQIAHLSTEDWTVKNRHKS